MRDEDRGGGGGVEEFIGTNQVRVCVVMVIYWVKV
jgi:hypothetical protein